MLQQIYVKNFILLDEVNLDLQKGMSAFIGETGAGKSLLMDAIGILRGDRINVNMIKTNCDQAIIEGVFSIHEDSKAYAVLMEKGYSIEDNLLIITRQWNKDGKSTIRINSRTCTLSTLREILADCVDIHSQHDTQYLMNPKNHLSLLDEFIHDHSLHQKVKDNYQNYHESLVQLDAIENSIYKEDDLDFLTYQLNEIDNVELQENELEALEDELENMQRFEKTSHHLMNAMHVIDGENGSQEKLYEAIHELSYLQEIPEFKEIYQSLYDTYYVIDDLNETLKQRASQYEYDEYRLNEIQDRITVLKRIYRKYGPSFEDVLAKKNELENAIDAIIHRNDWLKKQKKIVEETKKIYDENAAQLSNVRKTNAKKLQNLVVQQLKDLKLEHATFEIQFNEGKPSKQGSDQVSFYVSMNSGERLMPLQNCASGGELSRFMLGLKAVFAKLQGVETIIFDEIDSGVSGSVAFSIGRKMQEIAENIQVFCVTHLAPVAACANQIYFVNKEAKKECTSTSIILCDETQSIKQLAMISSGVCSDSSMQAAKELWENAKN